ncbi:ABC-three component system protein [Tautonia plasticadhaerens]|uniref:ABC-three component systems C-terminal domain-containing protein n=1 Tax=Tautonia plasticadhaerens TaxID=2527974 RepID=A0A518HA03_9BACT|nr:ABC-three component system protein [Tautonia plasticadhaerens]QDV37684.1 hypothetical protein ElP_56270 [Tautonia plasticadhaerens]
MSSSPSPYDASASALGYFYQCRYALLLALTRVDEPDYCVSIEKLDDVAFHASPDTPGQAAELLQFKHHSNRTGGLGDSSPDVWKSLKIWSEAARQSRIDLARSSLCLLTTSRANDRNAVRFLRPASSTRNPLQALDKITAAGAKSKNSVVRDAYECFASLPLAQRQALFHSTYLLDGALTAAEVESALGAALHYAVHPRHRTALLQRLEGWWFQTVVRHLGDEGPPAIPVSLVQGRVFEIQEDFRRENLPDDQWNVAPPDDASPDDDGRTFVRQLLIIGVTAARLSYAQEDHYRAFAQRSRWAKDELLGFEEVARYESRLVDGWRERFAIMRECVEGECDEPTKTRQGRNLYDWIVTEAPSRPALWVRPNFSSEYLTRGSYHMLSDQLRVGWHTEYDRHLSIDAAGSEETET